MGSRIRNLRLTPRRKQILASMYWRLYNEEKCVVADLLGDLGISHFALFDHLEALKRQGLVSFPGRARNLSSTEQIQLTPLGKQVAKQVLEELNKNPNDPLPEILESLTQKYFSQPRKRSYQKTLYGTIIPTPTSGNLNRKINEVVRHLFRNNITEPVMTSLTMYSDIDQLLYDLKKTDNTLFQKVSRGWLNLEIREGRLASIAIPVAIRGTLPMHRLYKVLRSTWTWPEIVASASMHRYKVEAHSLGLINIAGQLVTSTKPSTTYVLDWLAGKTYTIFENSFSPNPKLSLILYREIFKMPSEEEIYEPETNKHLEWLQLTKEALGSEAYTNLIGKTFNILQQIGAIAKLEDRLIPYGYLRMLNDIPEIREKIRRLLNKANEGNVYAKLLLLIHSKPGITKHEIARIEKTKHIEEILDYLRREGLIIAAILPGGFISYYTVLHMPYIKTHQEKPEIKDVNATVRNYLVYILSQTRSIFTNSEQLSHLYTLIEKLQKQGEIDSRTIVEEYGVNFALKFTRFAAHLEPIINIREENSEYIYTVDNKPATKKMLDIVSYEILTGSEALGEYSYIWALEAPHFDINKLQKQINELKDELLK